VGRVSGARWVEWYLDRSQPTRADLVLRWSWASDGALGGLAMDIARVGLSHRQGEGGEDLGFLSSTIATLKSDHPGESELLCRAVELQQSIERARGGMQPQSPGCRCWTTRRRPEEASLLRRRRTCCRGSWKG